MMEICEIPDFTIKDFMTPNAARLRRHLSGIINFAKFREERLVLLQDLSNNREVLVDQLNQLREKNETLNNRLSLLREQTKEETSIINALESECREIETTIGTLNQTQNRLKEETTQLKTSSAELKESIATKTQQQEELTVQRKQLSLQIVSSPEKFRKQIVEVGQQLQGEQKEAKLSEKKVRELTTWLANVDESNEAVGAANEAVLELRQEVDRQKAVMGELDAQRQSIAAERAALSELEQNAHQLQRAAGRAEEKLQHLKKQISARAQDNQMAVDDLHRQLIEAEALRLQVRYLSVLD